MSRAQFKEYMHAFASIASMEKMNCDIKGGNCSIEPELGWSPAAYFKVHKELLNRMLSETKDTDLKGFIRRQQVVIDRLITSWNEFRIIDLSHWYNQSQ